MTNRIVVTLVGLVIGGLVGVALGLAADKPLPPEQVELLEEMEELDRRARLDSTQERQLHEENEDIEREIERLRSEISGEPGKSEKYWDDLARYTDGAGTCDEILRELDRWGQQHYGAEWEEK